MACWITDGSDGFTTNEDVVTLSYIKGRNGYFNAMWQDGDGVSSGEHYWKIHFPRLVYITAVGLTSKDHFKQGYDCRSLKYLGLGILSNGIRLLVDNFGPEFGEGDVIGILASFEGDRLKVYIDVNGRSLGLAFDVPASIFKSVYPMVSFTSSGSATCTKQTEIPDGIKTRAPAAPAGIQGNWELTYFEENGVELEPTCEATTKITKSDADEYSLNVEVPSIRMSTNLSMVDGNWKTSDVSTTLMDDESKKFENSLSSLIENVKIVEAGESGNLSVKSDTISSNWTRYDSSPELFTGDPFVGDPLLDEPYTRTVIKIRPGMFMPKNE